MKKDVVVKSNRLTEALQRLSLSEVRLLQLAVVEARQTGMGLSAEKPLRIDAKRYAEAFDVSWDVAYKTLIAAETRLFERKFTIIDKDYQKPRKSRWIQDVLYLKDQGSIQLTFTRTVVDEITRIDGKKDFFTQYVLQQTSKFGSNYSVRLYELMARWRNFKGETTPLFVLDEFRSQLGLGVEEYPKMSDFKRRVLDHAVKEINQYSDIHVEYEQVKNGRSIIGFKFRINEVSEDKNVEDVSLVVSEPLTHAQAKKFAGKITAFCDKNRSLPAVVELGNTLPAQFDSWYAAKDFVCDQLQTNKFKKYEGILAKVGYKETRKGL